MKILTMRLFFPILLSFFFIGNISSQEIDKTFLDSLPEDIKKDVMGRAGKNDDEKDTYRSSKYSSKLQKEEELLILKERLEKDLIELNKRLDSDDSNLKIPDEDALQLFGSDFFNTIQTSFMPINEPNLNDNYILDYGDELEVQFTGPKDLLDTYKLNRDGSINIEQVGKINLIGLTLKEASELIKAKASSKFVGIESYTSLTAVKDVNVLISGNAYNPGVYTLSGNSNILHALSVAGGINDFGSYREVNLIRNGKIIETLDIYDLLISGKYKLKKRLRTGDVIFVESAKNIVAIDGAVKRPAKYELKSTESLDVVIDFALGLNNFVDLDNIYLDRILDGELKSLPIINISQFENINVIDGDKIYIREHTYRYTSIKGAVLKPGEYLMSDQDTVQDLVRKAGGYTQNAYPFGAVYENDEAKYINEMATDQLYKEFLDNIIMMSQQNVSGIVNLDSIIELAAEVKYSKPNGRIVVDLSDESPENQLILRDGDSLIIPEKTNHVYIYGEVSSEGATSFSPNEGVMHYINKSGGFKSLADEQSIFILHPNGETQRYMRKKNIFASQPEDGVKIYPGSVIFIPREMDKTVANRLSAQAYVSILGNLGIALASLSSINNN